MPLGLFPDDGCSGTPCHRNMILTRAINMLGATAGVTLSLLQPQAGEQAIEKKMSAARKLVGIE